MMHSDWLANFHLLYVKSLALVTLCWWTSIQLIGYNCSKCSSKISVGYYMYARTFNIGCSLLLKLVIWTTQTTKTNNKYRFVLILNSVGICQIVQVEIAWSNTLTFVSAVGVRLAKLRVRCWFGSNLFTPMILLVLLLTICHTIVRMFIGRIRYQIN